jgi:hypothetical protein
LHLRDHASVTKYDHDQLNETSIQPSTLHLPSATAFSTITTANAIWLRVCWISLLNESKD